MKKDLYRLLSCLLLMTVATASSYAANGIIETRNYKICPGDTIEIDTRKTVVYSDTILYDTLQVADPTQDSVYQYIVNVYPPFLNLQERTLERGTSFDWRELTIDKAGTYERVYKTTEGQCDSIYRLIVRERVETRITQTLCKGSSISFGNQTITEGGVYRDTMHFSDYDSITVLTLNLIKPDTVITTVRIPEGESWEWNGTPYSAAGTYYTSPEPNRFGCDSLNVLQLTTYAVDTIDTTAILCPNETITWHGMTQGTTGEYAFPGTRTNGDKVYYRLHLTVKEQVMIDTTFTICDDERLQFYGKTYVNAGEYYDAYTCDTTYKITIVKHPTQLHLQTGVLDRTNPYYWQYRLDGEAKTDTLYEPGVYEHTTHNAETGCNDIWRLVLTRDESSYHFIETVTICENEPFDWRGRTGLNRSGIGQTTHYYDRYRTAADQDSIYELVLTVNPVLRTSRTIPFCGSVVWGNEEVTESKVVIDTLQSVQYQCDSIVTTVLVKGIPFVHHDTVTIQPGETIEWRGQTITNDGQYADRYVSTSGCDSVYTLGVGLQAEAPTTKTRTWYYTMCEGSYYEWFGQKYFNAGTYVDTVFAANTTDVVDSLHILQLTVNPIYASSERITFLTFPQTYREQVIPNAGTYTFRYTSSLGCDSVITSYIDQEVYRDEISVTICPNDTYIWSYDGQTYNVSGKYTKVEQDGNGNDSIIHVLNLNVRYIPETQIEETICKGETYEFGDQSLTESGVYRHTYHVSGGCDSVVVLSLNVLNPDTSYTAIQRPEGSTYVWNGTTYYKPGKYFYYGTNAHGCDSVAVLNFTYNQVDTIEEHLTVCPNELPFVWHGIEGNQTKHYTKVETETGGNMIVYSLYLTVREVVETDTTFVICADGSVSFNGQTYTEAGHYRDYLNCDTLMNVHIVKHPQQVYETNAKLGAGHGYTWTYWDNGEEKTETFHEAGTYEFESPNATTGCSEIWRLVLTKDETSYHFIETETICEGEDYSWRGLTNLGQQGIGETSHYFDSYKTRAGQDSIYELVLTVTPIERTVRTVVFCGETTWKGKTYDRSAVVYDTIATANGCYRIERINLDKATPFYQSETKDLPQGTVLHWHGQNITTDGTYYDYNTTIDGCDSIYQITVTIIPATPENNQYAEELSTCEGDTIVWRGKDIWRSGTYVDTVYKAGTSVIDSVFTLKFTVWPSPKDTIYQHMYTCAEGASIRYNGQDYYQNTTVVTNFHTIHGCDSVVKVYMHFNTAVYLERSDTIADTELPHRWTYQLYDPYKTDTILTTAGTYYHYTESEGGCRNEERMTLVVHPTYLYALDTTVCETSLPFVWRGMSLQHPIGETKQYEDHLTSVFGTDSIYRVNLTIVEAPRRTERIEICENKDTIINGKSYFNPVLYPVGVVFHDTAYKHSAGNECDSIIYYEITKTPQRHIVETRIMHEGETIDWRGETITELVTKTYTQETEIDPATGCEMIYQLRVIAERKDVVSICALDTPYVWGINGENYYSTGLYTDTVFDAEHFITDYHSLDLTVQIPVDTVKVLRGCQPEGVTWNGVTYLSDTIFRDTLQTCDTLYTVKIQVDTTYTIEIVDTICEQALPYILGRQNPDTIWSEVVRYPHTDKTACGCDSTVYLTLRIIPELTKNDSTFVCEDYLTSGGDVVLGNLTDPWFEHRENGRYSGTWQGKWTGVHYTNDTIVYNCDSSYFHHIIVRPHQALIPEKTYALCKGDSVQLFWPHDTTWIKTPGVYYDTVPTISAWMDTKHNTVIHNDRAYECDSITKWTVIYADTLHEHLYAHIRQGETYVFNDSVLSTTGVYDSIGDYVSAMDSAHHFCKAVYSLHLTVDPTYSYQDTIEICHIANREYTYTFNDDRAEHFAFKFQTPDQDSALLHFTDSTKHLSYGFYDHFYDLVVYYRQQYETHLYDTICNNGYRYWNEHHKDGSRTTRTLHNTGTYFDTVPATNMCDSVIILHLYVREPVQTKHFTATVTDREIPYLWSHTWKQADGTDTTHVDSLWVNGDYEYTMPNRFGCDSVVTMNFTVRETHIFRDTIDICAPIETTHTHFWNTGYEQTFTVPNADDTISYADTLITYYPLDSIYVLFVNYKAQTITYLDQNLCYGDSLQFGLSRAHQPRFLKQSGVYRDTLVRTENGCDSIIELRLNVFPRYYNDSTKHIADVDTPYVWIHYQNGAEVSRDSLYIPGSYEHIYSSAFGCDSIDHLQLYIHPTYQVKDDTIHICANEIPYTWRGLDNITTTGDYQYGEQTKDGYDSVHYVHVHVWPMTYDTISATICEGDSLRWGLTKANMPRFLKAAGMYSDTLTSIHGCDSIIVLRLNTYPRYFNDSTKHIADVDTPYVWIHKQNGVEVGRDSLYASGRYGFRYPTTYGCDSIDSLTLFVHPTYVFHDSVTICYSETPYTWFDKQDIYETGTYTKRFLTTYGYDSTYIRYVEVLPMQNETIPVSICEGSSYLFAGKHLTEQGTYVDTLTAVNGCDSVATLILTVNKPYFNTRTEHILEGDSTSFFGEVYKTTGTYTHYGRTPEGCDSTSVLQVVVHPLVDTTVTVCKTELPYLWVNKWNGKVTPLYAAGIYRNDTSFVNGERMFYGLRLVVNEPTDTTIYREICEGDLYNFNNRFLGVSGEYRDTIKNGNGCDSVVILHLNVLQKYYHSIERSIYEGDTVMFQGAPYSTAGIYPVRFTSSFGCDSIVELRLTVNRLFDDSVSVCANELPLVWRGKTIYESGIYRDSVVNTEGKLSTIGLKVTVLPTSRLEEPIVATICEGDFYQFDNRMLTESGTYYDTLTAVNGCDSIVMLSLQVQPINHQTETRTIFAGDTVMFHGDTCMTSGIYTYTSQNSNGCVDTYQLILTVLKDFKIDTTAYVCSNELPFVWHGYEYSETGDYALPTAWTDSSRVVTTLHLFVRETEYVEENINLCFGNTFIINGDTIRESCSYYDTVPAENGCDRVTRYIISVQPIFEKWDTVYISDQDTYTFCPDATTGVPRVLDKTGDYECISKTDYGCDVIHHLHLEVHPSYHFTEYLDLCAPDTIEWHGQKIYAEGKAQVNPYLTRYGDNVEKHYFDRYLTTYGFDSIYELVVTNHPSFYTYEQHLIKELDQEGTYIHGIHITKLDTIYRDTLKTAYGCDSIFQIAVNTKRTITVERTKYICDDGNGYNFYGQIITKTGKYSAVVSGGAESSFDTIVNLTLIVNPISMTKTRIVITDEDVPYIHNGKYYDDTKLGMPQWDQASQRWVPDVVSTVIEEEYINQYGCDSINLLEFVVTTHYSDWNQIPLCTGSQLIIDNDTIKKAGYYTFVRRSKVTNRLDSLYRIEVYEAPVYEMPAVKRSICVGDTVIFGGQTFDRNGLHRVTLKSVDGCDSVITLDLTVNPAFRMDTTVRVWEEQLPFEWENRKYYNDGEYKMSWQIGDCDSTRVLHLYVLHPDTIHQLVCADNLPYAWRGKTYTQSGYYTEKVYDIVTGEVVEFYVLHLDVQYATSITSARIEEIEEGDPEFEITFTYTGYKPSTYDIVFDAHAKKEGFKDIFDAPLLSNDVVRVPLPQPVGTCTPDNKPSYTRPDYYSLQLVLGNEACGVSRSQDLQLLIKYPSWVIEQNWNDVVAPRNAEYNGGYEFSQISWYLNGLLQPSNGLGYLHNDGLRAGDLVHMEAVRRGETRAIPSFPIIILDGDQFDPYPTVTNPFVVAPTQAPRYMPVVNVTAMYGGMYEIYSFTGMMLEKGVLSEGTTQVTLPSVNGIYFIRTTYGEQSQTDKILIY